jgi:hypothetical protein
LAGADALGATVLAGFFSEAAFSDFAAGFAGLEFAICTGNQWGWKNGAAYLMTFVWWRKGFPQVFSGRWEGPQSAVIDDRRGVYHVGNHPAGNASFIRYELALE